MAERRIFSDSEKERLLAALHRDRIWLTMSDRLLWRCGWLVSPPAFGSWFTRMARFGLALLLIYGWFLAGPWASEAGAQAVAVYWLVPSLYVGLALAGTVYFYLPRPGPSAGPIKQLFRHGLAGLAVLIALRVWYHDLRQLAPLQFVPQLTLDPFPGFWSGVIGGSIGAAIGPWRQRKRLKARGIDRWGDYVTATLVEDVF